MSEETNCFVADLHIDGKKVGYAKNNGQGGCTDYNAYTPEDHKIIAEAEVYCKTLPKTKFHDMEFDQSLESVIDEYFENWLNTKELKKFEKKMETGILVGSPDENHSGYSYYNFKMPLSKINKGHLQSSIMSIKNKLKNGEVILNTNLQALGLNV